MKKIVREKSNIRLASRVRLSLEKIPLTTNRASRIPNPHTGNIQSETITRKKKTTRSAKQKGIRSKTVRGGRKHRSKVQTWEGGEYFRRLPDFYTRPRRNPCKSRNGKKKSKTTNCRSDENGPKSSTRKRRSGNPTREKKNGSSIFPQYKEGFEKRSIRND